MALFIILLKVVLLGTIIRIIMVKFLESIGAYMINIFQYVGEIVILLYKTTVSVAKGSVRWNIVIHQMDFLGVSSTLIVLITTTFTGMVIALQLADFAVDYGLANIIGGSAALAMSRELGPILTAIVIAGRAGSAITAEIGSMKVSEQIDALRCLAVDPNNYIVAPRVIACVLMLPVLGLFSVYAGMIGGAWIANSSAGVPYEIFWDSVVKWLTMDDLIKGLIKCSIFGLLISVISCQEGLHTGRGAAGVGKATTRSVVMSYLAIFISNFFLTSWMFTVG